MNIDKFWLIIQGVHDSSQGDMGDKCKHIAAAIGKLSATEATSFAEHFEDSMHQAYSWPHWGAAYVIQGGCGDDSFSDFRSSLVSRGRPQFEAALANPDSLANVDMPEDEWAYEGFDYAVTDGVKLAGGKRNAKTIPPNPSGQEWTEDAVYSLFPRLASKYA